MEPMHGFIHEKIDIKILILYILRRLPLPVDRDRLAALVLCDDGITYFDFAECLGELVDTNHVATNGISYEITEKGKRNGEITETSLPYSVRLIAERNVSEVCSEMQRSELISATHTLRRGGGFNVALKLTDDLGTLIEMNIFVTDETQAMRIEDNFKKHAEMSYAEIMDILTRKD